MDLLLVLLVLLLVFHQLLPLFASHVVLVGFHIHVGGGAGGRSVVVIFDRETEGQFCEEGQDFQIWRGTLSRDT